MTAVLDPTSAPTDRARPGSGAATLVGPRRCRTRPAGATRVGARPRPRVRPLGDVLADLVRSAAARARDIDHIDQVAPVPGRPPARERPEALDVPDPRPAALRVLRAVAEILDGTRPATHLRSVCDPELYERLQPVLRSRASRAGRGAPRRAGQVRGVRSCRVAPHAVEVAAAVHRDGRARALAARLEHDGQGWRLTALEVG